MNKKFIALLFAALMFATIPIAAGIQPKTTTDDTNDAGLFGRTVIRGIIIGYKEQGIKKTFTAVICHYTVYKLFQQPQSGFYVFQHLTFIRKFTGYHGVFYINGVFRGTTFT